jgi:hypothetical protein
MYKKLRQGSMVALAIPLALVFFNRLSRGEIKVLSVMIFCLLFFGCSGYFAKRRLSIAEKIGRVAALLVFCAVLTGAYAWHFWPRTSFAFLGPAFFSPPQSWDFAIGHRGPNPNDGVELTFTDEVLKDRIVREHQQTGTPISTQEINSYMKILNVGDIDPLCRNHFFAQQFFWNPVDLDHEHYSLVISSKEIQVVEDLRMERLNGSWFYQAEIKNREDGDLLLACRDDEFPTGKSDDRIPKCSQALSGCKE